MRAIGQLLQKCVAEAEDNVEREVRGERERFGGGGGGGGGGIDCVTYSMEKRYELYTESGAAGFRLAGFVCAEDSGKLPMVLPASALEWKTHRFLFFYQSY